MDVRLPNGKVISGVPDGTPKDVIMQKAISSGMATQADFGVTQPVTAEQTAPEKTFTDKVIGGVASAADSGLDTLGTAVGGATALVDQANPFTDNDPQQLIDSVKDKFKFDFISERGEAGQAELAENMQFIEPTVQALQNFKDEAGQQGLDLTGSPAFATFVNTIPDILMAASGRKIGNSQGVKLAASPEVSQAKKTAQAGIDAADETGIKQLTSDVFPPETRLGKLFQTQGELVAGFQRKGQQDQRVRAVEKLANQYDIKDGVGFERKIVAGLKNSVEKSKAALSEMYDQSSKKLDELGNVSLSKTKEFASKIIERETAKGSLSNDSVINDMQALIEAPDNLSFEMVKEIRSGVGANMEKLKRNAPVQGSGDLGLLKRTYAQMTNDMTTFADKADAGLSEKWKKSNKAMSEFATGANKQGAKAIIKNGDTTPEVVDTLLFSTKASDLDFLSKNLDSSGKVAAKQRVLQRILDKSSIDGDDINPNKFLTQMNKNKIQLNKMFDPKEVEAIEALRVSLSKTRRAQDASVSTPTGQQLSLAAALAIPAALIPGIIQGVIEVPAIRNLMIRRKAAKTAKEIAVIDDKMKSLISEKGLTGALAGAAAAEETQN